MFIAIAQGNQLFHPSNVLTRLLKIDRHNGTNQNRLNTFEHKMLRMNGHLIGNTQLDLIKEKQLIGELLTEDQKEFLVNADSNPTIQKNNLNRK